MEHNCTMQAFGDIPIHEPCNYAANLAYYHTTVELCDRLGWSISDQDGKLQEQF